MTNYSINRGSEKNRARVQVDAENYREKREQSLERLAEKVAGKVTKYRRNVTLEPMNAYERHVIHTALQDTPSVTTFSIGTEPKQKSCRFLRSHQGVIKGPFSLQKRMAPFRSPRERFQIGGLRARMTLCLRNAISARGKAALSPAIRFDLLLLPAAALLILRKCSLIAIYR